MVVEFELLLVVLPLLAEPPEVLPVVVACPVVAIWLDVLETFTEVVLLVLPLHCLAAATDSRLLLSVTVLLLSKARAGCQANRLPNTNTKLRVPPITSLLEGAEDCCATVKPHNL